MLARGLAVYFVLNGYSISIARPRSHPPFVSRRPSVLPEMNMTYTTLAMEHHRSTRRKSKKHLLLIGLPLGTTLYARCKSKKTSLLDQPTTSYQSPARVKCMSILFVLLFIHREMTWSRGTRMGSSRQAALEIAACGAQRGRARGEEREGERQRNMGRGGEGPS